MRLIRTANGDGSNALEGYIQPGETLELELPADTDVAFPPEVTGNDGGAFLIYVPAGSDLEFKTGFDAADLLPGEIIHVADPAFAGVRMGGRVLEVAGAGFGDRLENGRLIYLMFFLRGQPGA